MWIAQWGSGQLPRLDTQAQTQKCPPASAPLQGRGGRKAGRGSVKRGTRQGEERRRGPPVTSPSRAGKGSPPPSAQTQLGVFKDTGQTQAVQESLHSCLSFPSVSGHLISSCALGLGPRRARVPPVTGRTEGEALRGDGQSCPPTWGGARGRSWRSPPAGFLRGQPGSLSVSARQPGPYLHWPSILQPLRQG